MLSQGVAPLLQTVQGDPGAIMGPISHFFGHIINFIYTGLVNISPVNALGFSIIIMTFIIRGALVPSQIKMQKNSAKTRAIKPELDKIREKYGNTRDPELLRKMRMEQQALNQKHGINMVASCLPLLITMPIFIALFGVFGRAFLFIPSINEAYSALSQALIDLGPDFRIEVLTPIYQSLDLQNNATINGVALTETSLYYVPLINRFINAFTEYDWNTVFYAIESGYASHYDAVRYLYNNVMTAETFFGLNLVTSSGWAWPGIIIPILSVGTMVLSSWQTSKLNPATDPQTKMMQRITMTVLPLMFGWFTVGAASAVGLYWVAGNVFLIVQNLIVLKFFPHKIGLGEKPAKA
ncbi:MAG: YidC/Oxa1 family membrane protein insertase [Defluviitaleaceae bacterium]|nr:YidC/Oxa1 family membrane protein insertase [Defluviitaleaceae bacterium]